MRIASLIAVLAVLAGAGCDDGGDAPPAPNDSATLDADVDARATVDADVGASDALAEDVADEVSGPAEPRDAAPAEVLPIDPAPELSCAVRPCPFTSIGLGQQRTCTVQPDGSARCWGKGVAASTLPPRRFVSVQPLDADHTLALNVEGRVHYIGGPPLFVPFEDKLTTLATDGRVACGLTADRQARCFGFNRVEPLQPPPAGPFAELAISGGGACGRRDDGSATCWSFSSSYPGFASRPGPYQQLAVGDYRACGVRPDQELECWQQQPVDVGAPPGKIRKVQVGGRNLCVLTTTGSILCWSPAEPGPAQPPRPMLEGSYVDFHFKEDGPMQQGCGVRADGSWRCWGSNDYGEGSAPEADDFRKLGRDCGLDREGRARCYLGPEASGNRLPEGSFVAIDDKDGVGCLLAEDGRAACWQPEDWGPIKNPPPAPAFVVIRAEWLRVSGVLIGGACAIRKDTRAIECWSFAASTTRMPPPPGRFLDLALGDRTACAIHDDGTTGTSGAIACWGPAGPIVAEQPTAGRWKQVVLDGDRGACALSELGDIACWGDGPRPPPGRFTELAVGWNALAEDGSLVPFDRSDRVPTGRYVQLARGQRCALTASGRVKCWGLMLR